MPSLHGGRINKMLQFSVPTKSQVIHGVERALVVFVLAVAAYLKLTPDAFTTAAWSGAGYAGVAAVYQLILSTFTTL
jgi:hypothetical protein